MAIDVETERTPLAAALAAAKERIAELQAELEREKVKTARCLWCKFTCAKNDADAISKHLTTCSEHPMRALEREVRRLRSLMGLGDDD